MMLAEPNAKTPKMKSNRSNGQRNAHYGGINGYQTATYTGSTHISAPVEEFKGKR
jgi:hypothetical protein